MKKIMLPIAFLFVFSASAFAQKEWTLKECIDYAIENNIQLKQTELQVEQREINLNTSENSRLPSLNASMGANMFFGRGPSRSGVYTDNTQTSSSMSINASAPIYQGSRIKNEIIMNEINLKSVISDYESAKDDLSLNITSLYMQVLFNKEMAKVLEQQVKLSEGVVDKTKILLDNGRAAENDYYEALSLLAKDKYSLKNTQTQLALYLLDLAQALNFSDTQNFDVVAPQIDSLNTEFLDNLMPSAEVYQRAVDIRPEIKSEELRLASSEQQLKVTKSYFLPSINLSVGYSNSYYYSFMEGATNSLFMEQMRRNGSETIGLSVSIPIFNRFATRNQVKLAKINIKNQNYALENAKQSLRKEIDKAYYNADASRENYVAADEAMKASELAFKYEKLKMEAGKSTIFDFNDSKTRLVSSVSDMVKAKYQFLFNKKILDFYYGIPLAK